MEMELHMTQTTKQSILCAVRGQSTSRTTVEHAIELALDSEGELTFMLVLSTEALARAGPLKAPLRAILKQLDSIGEFAMSLLEDRARNRGVEDVGFVVKRGKPAETIRNTITELQPAIVVLGEPVADEPRAIFSPNQFEHFVTELRQDTEAEIVVVETPVEDLPK